MTYTVSSGTLNLTQLNSLTHSLSMCMFLVKSRKQDITKTIYFMFFANFIADTP